MFDLGQKSVIRKLLTLSVDVFSDQTFFLSQNKVSSKHESFKVRRAKEKFSDSHRYKLSNILENFRLGTSKPVLDV